MPKWLAKLVVKWYGVTIKLNAPLPDKCVIPVISHTSNWDFPLGIALRSEVSEPIGFVGKSSLFRWPFGGFFRWLGGVPVDRSKSTNFVQAVADVFQQRDIFKLAVAPEGTRRKVTELKTGFYYIAKTAQIPIVACAFDFGASEVRFSAPLIPSDDEAADFAQLYNFWRGTKGLIPENSFDVPVEESTNS